MSAKRALNSALNQIAANPEFYTDTISVLFFLKGYCGAFIPDNEQLRYDNNSLIISIDAAIEQLEKLEGVDS